jgi:two-component system, LytTR family, response regulator
VSPRLRTLIVDDEPPARRLARSLLAPMPGIEVVGEAVSGREAVHAIETLHPDIVLLDVQMPELDGFEVIAAVGLQRIPAVVFITAYDQYALRAFDVHAVDYLLKPYDNERFAVAIERAVHRAQNGNAVEYVARLEKLLKDMATHQGAAMIALKIDGRHVLLDTRSIDSVEASDKTVLVEAAGNVYPVRESMNSIERRLDARQFIRVRRSTIVNISKIAEIQPWFQGDLVLILRDGKRVTTGRAYRDSVRELLARLGPQPG